MKNLKKALGTLLVLAMILALAAPALAVDITIDDGAVTGANYSAYRLMSVTEGGGGFAYTLNTKYAAILKTATGQSTDAAVIAHIAALDAAGIRAFADAVYRAIVAAGLSADKTTTTNKFTGVDSGYYLIAETKTGSSPDVYSLVMLDTAGKSAVTIETKEEVPTLEKKVKETNDSIPYVSEWQDAADYDIGDIIPFQLTGTVPAQYASYTTYSYIFRDYMSSGLTFNASSVVVKVDGVEIPASNYSVVTAGLGTGVTFEVRFANLKTISAVKPGSKITVEYTATLNSNAKLGADGNPNEALLEYSNNPYSGGTGKTPKDKVIVFTYKLTVDKVDGAGKALSGAGFTLYKFNGTDYVAVGAEIKGVTTFTFSGIDAGRYKLVETTVPDGYNKADDVLFRVVAEYDTNSDSPALTSLTIVIEGAVTPLCEPDPKPEEIKITVVNNLGVELPSTGGIGTTIFYIVGGLLVACTAVLLITKKRMSTKD